MTLIIGQLTNIQLPNDNWSRGPTHTPSPVQKRATVTNPCGLLTQKEAENILNSPIIEIKTGSVNPGTNACTFRTNDPSRYLMISVNDYENEEQAKDIFDSKTSQDSQESGIIVSSLSNIAKNTKHVGATVIERKGKKVYQFEAYTTNKDKNDAESSIEVTKEVQNKI